MPFAASAIASWVSALGVGRLLELGLLDLKLVLLLGDLRLGLDIGVVRLLRSLCARHCDVALRVRAGDRRVLRYLRDVVDTEVLDRLVVVREVLDVERDDLEAHAGEIGVGVRLHHVSKLLAVEHHLLSVHLADDFTHVALEHLLRDAGDVVRRGVEEVHRGEVDLLWIAADLDVHDCIDVDVDEVGVGNRFGSLHVDLDQLKRHLVEPFEEGNAEVRPADYGAALEAGDDVRHVRRCLDVGNYDENDKQKNAGGDQNGLDRHG